MLIKRLYLSTGNKGKVKEVASILEGIDILSIDNTSKVEETGKTFKENADIKAIFLSKQLDDYVIADDSGLCCVALDNAPGIHSARYASENSSDNDNILKLLSDMYNVTDRKAYFICNVSLAKAGEVVANFEGILNGYIAYECRGENGFGYDPIFMLSDNRHLAELADREKNNISHRFKALTKLKNYLNGL